MNFLRILQDKFYKITEFYIIKSYEFYEQKWEIVMNQTLIPYLPRITRTDDT